VKKYKELMNIGVNDSLQSETSHQQAKQSTPQLSTADTSIVTAQKLLNSNRGAGSTAAAVAPQRHGAGYLNTIESEEVGNTEENQSSSVGGSSVIHGNPESRKSFIKQPNSSRDDSMRSFRSIGNKPQNT